MENGLFIIVAIVVLALGIIGAVLAHRAQEKRRMALAELAMRLGWQFTRMYDDPGPEELFPAFTRGHSRARFNTLSGEVELLGRPSRAVMGDFRYRVTSSNGKTTTTRTYRFSYLIVEVPLPGVPDLLVRGEHLLDKIAGAVGFDDIDFESEEFSRRFLVKSPDRKFAYDVIHPRMMEFLMAGLPAPVDLRSGRLCLTEGARTWEPERFERDLAWVAEFFRKWPDYLVQDLSGRG